MIYKKLIIVLVILVMVYFALSYFPKGFMENIKLPEKPVKESSFIHIFPEKMDGFVSTSAKESKDGNAYIWCASGDNVPAKYFYRLSYANSGKTIDVDVYIPLNIEESKNCFEGNSDFFSAQDGMAYERMEIGLGAFFIDGIFSSRQVKSIFLLDKDGNYVVFSSQDPDSSSKEHMTSMAEKFEVILGE